jgi:hypothetical protein
MTSENLMNDWGYILRGFRFGFVRGAVSVIFITTILIWILEATEHDSPFRTVPGGRHSASHQHPYTRPSANQSRETDFSIELIHADSSIPDAGAKAGKAATTVGIQQPKRSRRPAEKSDSEYVAGG